MQTISFYHPGQVVLFEGLTWLIVSVRGGCAALSSTVNGSTIARLSDLEPLPEAA